VDNNASKSNATPIKMKTMELILCSRLPLNATFILQPKMHADPIIIMPDRINPRKAERRSAPFQIKPKTAIFVLSANSKEETRRKMVYMEFSPPFKSSIEESIFKERKPKTMKRSEENNFARKTGIKKLR